MKTISMLFLLVLFWAVSAHADDMGGSFLRLKSGSNHPQENGDVTHFTPIAIDGIYRLSNSFGLGLHFMYATGNHAVYAVQGPNLAGFNLSKTMVLPMASGDYFFDFGSTRIGLGVKAGALFYSDLTTLSSGTYVPDTTNSNTLFTAGPTVDIDLPLKGTWFVNVGGDYMISQNHYHFGSLYVGLGVSL